METNWIPIKGFELRYEVNSIGQVRSLISRGNQKAPHLLKSWTDKDGYLQVNLGKDRGNRIHRLVCQAFHGECPSGFEAAHLNGKRQDNRQENLVWATRRENERHSYAHGTRILGEKHPRAKFTRTQIKEIRRDKRSQRLLARIYGVSRGCICHIKAGRTWVQTPIEPPTESEG